MSVQNLGVTGDECRIFLALSLVAIALMVSFWVFWNRIGEREREREREIGESKRCRNGSRYIERMREMEERKRCRKKDR